MMVREPISRQASRILAVAGAARDHPYIMIFGLVLSIALMAVAAQLIARLIELRSDVQEGADEARTKLKARLGALATIIKTEHVADWTSLPDTARTQLVDWLAR